MIRTDALNGQQRQAKVANLGQQTVQCSLVGNHTADDGHSARLGGDLHSLEPRGPALVEAVFDADLVPHDMQLTAWRPKSRHP